MQGLKDFLTAGFDAGPIQVVVWEVLYVWALVITLAWFLNRFAFRPIIKVLEERAQRIADAQAVGDSSTERIDRAMAQHAERLAHARRESSRLLDEAKTEAEGVRAEKVGVAREKAEGRLAEARQAITQAADAAEAKLRADAEALARAIASTVLGREVK